MQEDRKIDDNIFEDEHYIEMLYSDKRRPQSNYPFKLAKYLLDNYYLDKGNILDIGCGRGDLLEAFHNEGFSVAGTDISPASIKLCEPHLVKTADLVKGQLPFNDGEFNYVFSKSVIEHLHNPMILFNEALRVLEKDGKAVIMTPSWMHNSWGPFYLDHTHVTPFTKPSLRDAMEMAGFKDVEVFHFYL